MDQKVLTAVDIATPTLRALQFLVRHGRSAVAVLSKEGKLITNLSISDLRCIQRRHCCPMLAFEIQTAACLYYVRALARCPYLLSTISCFMKAPALPLWDCCICSSLGIRHGACIGTR